MEAETRLPWSVLGTASIGVASAGFGLLVLLGAPRRAPNRFLALFLFLLAANQLFDVPRVRLPVGSPGYLLWYRLAAVCAALDPAALYVFAAIHPRPNALWRRWKVALVLATAGAFCVLAAWQAPMYVARPPEVALYAAWALYTAVVYTVVLVEMGRDVAREPDRPGAKLLFAGLCLAALPSWPRFFEAVVSALGARGADLTPTASLLAFLGIWIAAPIAVALVTVLLARRLPAQARTAVVAAVLGSVLLTLLLHAARGFDVTGRPLPRLEGALLLVRPILPHVVAIRWWLFGLLVSTAIVRDQLLGLSLAARRRAARILVATAFVLAGLVIVALAASWWGALEPRPMDFVVLGALVVASQRFRALVDRVAARVYGVPLPGAPAAYAAYRSAARQAAHEPAHGDATVRLARLRDELGIDGVTALALEADARGEPGGPLVPGDALSGRYQVGRLLARGSAGRVFAARDTLLQRAVVVKELLHDAAGNEAAALSEARAAGALQHPNVLVVYDVLHRPGASYIITEPAEGGSLEERLARGPGLAHAEGLALLDGILAGLAAVHERGLVHRDLKPGNVVLLADGSPKLADFGLARLHRSPTLGAGALAGTPAFMSPEQRAGEPATRASDVYAVGLLARQLVPSASGALADVIARALAPDPAQRWQDAGSMRAALARTGRPT